MLLTVTEQAQNYIKKQKVENKKLVLDFIDGDSPNFGGAISCALGVSFRLLMMDEEMWSDYQKMYTESFLTEIGEIYYKKNSEIYLDSQNILDISTTYNQLMLKGESGVIAEPVRMVDIA